MDYRVYSTKAEEGSKCVEAGDLKKAADIFNELVNSDISDLDKALMSCNVAVVCEKMNLPDDAIAWYDAAIAFERPYFRGYATERKASYLSGIGRDREAIAIYEEEYKQPYLMESDKERIWNNLVLLRNRRT